MSRARVCEDGGREGEVLRVFPPSFCQLRHILDIFG